MILFSAEDLTQLHKQLTDEHEAFMHEDREGQFPQAAMMRMWLLAALGQDMWRVNANFALLTVTTLDLMLPELNDETDKLAKRFCAHIRRMLADYEKEMSKLPGTRTGPYMH